MLPVSEEFNHLIVNRRTVKPEHFSDRPVEREIIEQVLENARWAPTHGLNEPWHFVVFSGASRHLLSGFLADWYIRHTKADKFNELKLSLLKERPLMSDYIIAICMVRPEDTKIPEIEDIEAVACAVQNMHLTATVYGLVAYWSTPGATYSKEVNSFLGLGERDRCLGFFYLGYPQNKPPQGKRTPIEHKLQWLE
ncbi:MAG: nitroreductase [Sphingobacteriales bacterium]|nr:MAG: nitroreductase [Sphingobacteriales bacterium]